MSEFELAVLAQLDRLTALCGAVDEPALVSFKRSKATTPPPAPGGGGASGEQPTTGSGASSEQAASE